jgi:uncharacterized protein
MTKTFCIKDASSEKFEETLEKELAPKFRKGMKVAVKLHMGEMKGMFSPDIAKRSIAVLKKLGCEPFLFDTVVLYPGPRHFRASYKILAAAHGFSEAKMGCPVVISDDYVHAKTDHMDVEVSKEMASADAMLVLTHFKGHAAASFGGAIKNLAMGCASPKSKKDQHKMGMPTVNDNCIACGICETVCPFGAMKVDAKARIKASSCFGCDNCFYACQNKALDVNVTFDTLLAESAFAAIHAMDGKPIYYVNDVRSITKECDCFPDPGDMIASDVGVLLSGDIVAIDKASIDLVIKQEGKNIFEEVHHHNPYIVIKEAERLGIGSAK